MAKDLTYAKEARAKLLSGAEKLAKTVSVTMGPQGKNVILGKFVGAPVLTKDGVSVAREITLADPVEELACQLIKEAAGRTNSIAGDGTTTATVLAHEVFRLGSKLIDDGYSPLLFKRGVEWALERVLGNLNDMSKPISGSSSLRNIASISANNDYEIGSCIAEAFDVVGLDGTVAAEASPGAETSVRFIDGLEVPAGFITESFLAGSGTSEISLNNPTILLCEEEISSLVPALGLFNSLSEQNIPLLIIAKNVKQEALATLVANNKIGRLSCAVVKMPVMGSTGPEGEREWMDCLSALCGANIVSRERGLPLSQVSFDDLGGAKKVSVNRFVTKILESHKDDAKIKDKLSVYEEDSKKILGEKARLDVRKRMAFLRNKAAMITVGYSTELELREKGDRVEDALCATRAALEEGFLPGGGTAMLRAAMMVDVSEAPEELRGAASVVIEACKRPISQIVENGHIDPDPIIKKILSSQNLEFGYNAATNSFEDLVEAGVIDPKKVTRTALQNAVSISLLLINTEAIVSEVPDNPSSWQPPAGWRPPEDGTLRHKY